MLFKYLTHLTQVKPITSDEVRCVYSSSRTASSLWGFLTTWGSLKSFTSKGMNAYRHFTPFSYETTCFSYSGKKHISACRRRHEDLYETRLGLKWSPIKGLSSWFFPRFFEVNLTPNGQPFFGSLKIRANLGLKNECFCSPQRQPKNIAGCSYLKFIRPLHFCLSHSNFWWPN